MTSKDGDGGVRVLLDFLLPVRKLLPSSLFP